MKRCKVPAWHMIELNDRARIVPDAVQWILERRKPGGHWQPISYCVTRDALLRCIREKISDPVDLSGVLALPAWHPDRQPYTAAKRRPGALTPDDTETSLQTRLNESEV